MTEYTPTTLDILEAYKGQILATDKPNVYEMIDEDQAIAEFNRWLVAERKRVAEYAVTKVGRKVTRVEVIDDLTGRAYSNYNASNVIVQLQDDGRTLKVFIG